MQENRPRRPRRTPPKGGASLPFVPIIIGVVIFGFVIGAALSVVGKHGPDGGAVAVSTSTPDIEATFPEVTPVPQPTERPEPALVAPRSTPAVASSPSPAASAGPKATAAPSAAGSPTASKAPQAVSHIAVAPVVSATATRFETPASEPTVAITVAPTAEPTPAATAAAIAVSPATAAPAPAAASIDADSDFARLAGNVVRQYLLALARGDTTSAYAVLSPAPGAGGETPPEAGTLDSSLHIAHIEARGSDSAATVNVDLTTANGPYYGQYTVHRSSTGAAVIVSHTFGKP